MVAAIVVLRAFWRVLACTGRVRRLSWSHRRGLYALNHSQYGIAVCTVHTFAENQAKTLEIG